MANGENGIAPENGQPNFNRRRIPPPPTFIQHVSEWLMPILTVAIIGVGGYIANRVWNMNETINVVATVQKEVRANQADMKVEIKEIKTITENNGTKLDDHLLSTGILQQSTSKIHHRSGIVECTGCHTNR